LGGFFSGRKQETESAAGVGGNRHVVAALGDGMMLEISLFQ
jgi:hypothetical protein